MKTVGIGSRTINFIIDTLIISFFTFFVYRAWEFRVYYYHEYFLVTNNFYALWLCFAITVFLYYIFFESIFKRTPGKWLSFSKVVNKKGTRPAFLQILLRTLVRLTIIDCFFIPFLDKPLHDYLSRTEVVEV
jgi:uncharacterized RDD family membrane protein YckC